MPAGTDSTEEAGPAAQFGSRKFHKPNAVLDLTAVLGICSVLINI